MKHTEAELILQCARSVREARSATLRLVAAELDAQAEHCQADWVNVLLRSGTRARITTLQETAALCRAAAKRAERGEPVLFGDEIVSIKKKGK